MIITIAQHELRLWFKTGRILKLLAFCQCILGLIFHWLLSDFYQNTQQSLIEKDVLPNMTEAILHPLFAWNALLFFLITPLLAAQTLTHERKTQTLTLFLTAPLTAKQIIMGKFIGTLLAQWFLLIPLLLMSLFLNCYHPLDWGHLSVAYLGLVLFLSAGLSLGFLVCSHSHDPTLAIGLSFATLLAFSLLEWVDRLFYYQRYYFSELSLLYHCKNFLSGLINSQDLLYYGILISLCLGLSMWRLQKGSYFK
jgi:ABC-2 type transport system permease protein